MERDIIIIFKGGTVQGIFSSGVVTAFSKYNLYPRVHSVYAVSSGTHNAAHFLAHNADVVSEVYYKCLETEHAFLKNMGPKMVFKKIWNLFIHKEPFRVINLDHVEQMERKYLEPKMELIKNSPINFLIRVFNPKTLKLEYLDGKVDTINRMAQSAKVPPYAHNSVETDEYFDGGIMPTTDFIKNVVEKYPDKKILYIFNDPKTLRRVTRYIPWDILDILFKTRYLGLRYGLKHLFNIFNYPYLGKVTRYKNVYAIWDDTGNGKREKDKTKLETSYQRGLQRGEELLRKIKHI